MLLKRTSVTTYERNAFLQSESTDGSPLVGTGASKETLAAGISSEEIGSRMTLKASHAGWFGQLPGAER